MLELKNISIENKTEIDELLSGNKGNDSEFTFTNLFIWRKSYHTRYTVINDIPCFLYSHNSFPRAAAIPVKPAGDVELEGKCIKAAEILKSYFSERNEECNLYIFEKKLAEKIADVLYEKNEYTEDRASFDYVYLVNDLANLSGKRFHGKKNHVNKFKRLYNWSYEEIDKNSKEECMDVFSRWCRLKGEEKNGCEEEYEAVYEIMSSWDKLDITGGCLRVDGKMVAFSVGEVLNPDMVVIHFEYADNQYEGAFPMMNQQFLIKEWLDFKYVNREEDMGIPGMRKAKESYHPYFLVEKYIIKL